MAGTLYLCATPIGNLEDITFRVLRVLREADLIAAEDTRNSIRLLNYFEIETPKTSYHEYNKFDKGRVLIEKLWKEKILRLLQTRERPGSPIREKSLYVCVMKKGLRLLLFPELRRVCLHLRSRDLRQEDMRLKLFCHQIKKSGKLS